MSMPSTLSVVYAAVCYSIIRYRFFSSNNCLPLPFPFPPRTVKNKIALLALSKVLDAVKDGSYIQLDLVLRNPSCTQDRNFISLLLVELQLQLIWGQAPFT